MPSYWMIVKMFLKAIKELMEKNTIVKQGLTEDELLLLWDIAFALEYTKETKEEFLKNL
jgi:hypothetical protein